MIQTGRFLLALCVVTILSHPVITEAAPKKTHLFICDVKNKKEVFKHKASFVPVVTKAFSKDTVIVVKDAEGNQAIRRWYKKWTPGKGKAPRWRKGEKPGDLYDRLIKNVRHKLGEKRPDTITFVWMQGERDASEQHGDVYEASFKGLLAQLQSDLKRKDINIVIGRISDHKLGKRTHSHWIDIRKIQVSLADSLPNAAWVNTDDLNGPTDDNHANKEGYKELGKRFAEKAVELIKKTPKK